MANVEMKHEMNVEGKWYTTHPDDDNGEGCIACNVCYSSAPELFGEDEDGNAYVLKQPESAEEEELAQEQMDSCPVSSIGIQ